MMLPTINACECQLMDSTGNPESQVFKEGQAREAGIASILEHFVHHMLARLKRQ